MTDGRYIRDKKISLIRDKGACKAEARREAHVPRRAEQWRGCDECGGQEQLLRLLRHCRSVTSTVEAPSGAMLLLCASQVCCAVVVLRWAVVLVYARGTSALNRGPKRAVVTETKSIRDPKFVA